MFDNIVRYLTTKEPLPGAQSIGYDYVLAGNGLFKRARNRHMEALIPLAGSRVAGLPPIEPYLSLSEGIVSGSALRHALDDAKKLCALANVEAMYQLLRRQGNGRTAIRRPRQRTGAASLEYVDAGDPDVLADVHSHHRMRAFFSATDDGDETGFRIYVVMGDIFAMPEIAVRVGIYGDHYPIPAAWVFDDIQPFKEVTRRGICQETDYPDLDEEEWEKCGGTP